MTPMNDTLDPVFSADRDGGSTAPESGVKGSNVVGRPNGPDDHAAGFDEPCQTPDVEREAFSGEEAVREGGSFDRLGLPVADDSVGASRQRAGDA
jgi:hypothetical protein